MLYTKYWDKWERTNVKLRILDGTSHYNIHSMQKIKMEFAHLSWSGGLLSVPSPQRTQWGRRTHMGMTCGASECLSLLLSLCGPGSLHQGWCPLDIEIDRWHRSTQLTSCIRWLWAPPHTHCTNKHSPSLHSNVHHATSFPHPHSDVLVNPKVSNNFQTY